MAKDYVDAIPLQFAACQVGAPFGSCKNISMPSSPMTSSAGSFSGSVQFSKSASTVCYPNRFVVGFISIPWMFMRASG
ncbi:hypothetical protein V6N12_047582 [Hibiscus sabdariffa]|uniref:Uncharacterized protein n=1 Tax=Hibiscus sabdariffa TaxID=183260 RepID=A0ABR2AG67_9ROSI